MGKIAEAYVEVTAKTQAFDKGLDQSKSKLTDWAESAQKLVAAFVIAKVGQDFLSFMNSAVKSASDLAEAANKAGVAFGTSFPKIAAFADEMASKFGIVKTEIYDMTAGLGFMLTNAKLTQAAASELAIALAKSAADVSSIQNMPIATVLEKMRAGIAGEAEPLRPLGVNISEENVQKKAPSLGFDPKHLTDQEKILTRISLIIEGLKYAEGDLAKTANEYANLTRKAAGDWENLKAVIGNEIKPVMSETIGMAYELVGAFKDAFGTSPLEAFSAYLKQVVVDMKGVREAASTMKTYWAFFRETLPYGLTAGKDTTSWQDIHGKLRAEEKALRPDVTAKAKADATIKAEAVALAEASKRKAMGADLMSSFLTRTIPGLLAQIDPQKTRQNKMGGAFSGFLANQQAHSEFAQFAGRGGPLSSHIMGAGEFASFAQERVSSGADDQRRAAIEAAKNTEQTVTRLDRIIAAMESARKGFAPTAIMRGAQ